MATSTATIASLRVLLGLDTAGFTKGRKEAESEMSKLNASVGRAGDMIAGSFAAVGVGIAAHAFVGFVDSAAQAIDVNAKLSDRLGITTESLIGMQHAAGLAGVDTESFNSDIEKMTKNLGEAAINGGPVEDALRGMGLSASALVNQNLDDSIMQIADGIAAIKNPAERAAAATAIFGKAGQALIPTLAGGAQGLRDATAEAEKLGIAYSRIDAANVEQANDAITRLGEATRGAANDFAVGLAPLIKVATDRLIEMAAATKDFRREKIDDTKEGVLGIADGLQWLGRESLKAQAGLYDLTGSAIAGFQDLRVGVDTLNGRVKGSFDETRLKSFAANLKDAAKEIQSTLAGDIKAGDISGQAKEAMRAANANAILAANIAKANDAMNISAARLGKIKEEMKSLSDSTTTPLDKYSKSLDILDRAVSAGIITIGRRNEVQRQLNKALSESDPISKTIKQLKEQVAMLGMSADAQVLYKLKTEGANTATRNQAAEMLRQIEISKGMQKAFDDAAERGKAFQDDLSQRAASVKDSLQTPMQSFELQVQNLNELVEDGKITWDQYTRAVRVAHQALSSIEGSQLGNFEGLIPRAARGNLSGHGILDKPPAPVVHGIDAASKREGPIEVKGQSENIELLRGIKTNTANINLGYG